MTNSARTQDARSNRSQTIWVTRHATRLDMVDPDWSLAADRPYDTPLAEKGLAEAQSLADRLAGEPVEAIYCSPFLRALQTAAPIARATGAPLRIEPGLCEWLREDWFKEIPELFPQAPVEWERGGWDQVYASSARLSFPEAWSDVAARLRKVAESLTATGDDVVLVGHGASVICALSALLDRDLGENPTAPPTAALFALSRRGPGEPARPATDKMAPEAAAWLSQIGTS